MACDGLIIRREAYSSPAAQGLVAALHADMLDRYDGVEGAGGEPAAEVFAPPHGAFHLALLEGRPVGCGGLCRGGDRLGEIRRMYVDPTARGRGIGRRLLASLEAAARELGYDRVRLETGDRQPEAIALYEACGYRSIERYGPYVDDPHSVCLEKQMDA